MRNLWQPVSCSATGTTGMLKGSTEIKTSQPHFPVTTSSATTNAATTRQPWKLSSRFLCQPTPRLFEGGCNHTMQQLARVQPFLRPCAAWAWQTGGVLIAAQAAHPRTCDTTKTEHYNVQPPESRHPATGYSAGTCQWGRVRYYCTGTGAALRVWHDPPCSTCPCAV